MKWIFVEAETVVPVDVVLHNALIAILLIINRNIYINLHQSQHRCGTQNRNCAHRLSYNVFAFKSLSVVIKICFNITSITSYDYF